MTWFEEIAAVFPKARDDEPPDLRSQIVRELRDHLECAYRGELLKCGNETEAERRVLTRFGDPKRLARKLWLEAMQEKIMSQRILMFWSGLMAAVCVVMGLLFWRVAEQSAEANRTFIASMQEANRELLEQGREFNLALLERLDRRSPDGQSGAAPQDTPDRGVEKAAEGAAWDGVALRLRLVQDIAGGKPAAGYSVALSYAGHSRREDPDQLMTSDAEGRIGSDLRVAPGPYVARISTPWGEFVEAEFEVHPGEGETVEIVCPGTAPPEFEVKIDVQWPQDLRGHNVGLLIRRESFLRKIAGRDWRSSPQQGDVYLGKTLVTNRGIVLMGERDSALENIGRGRGDDVLLIKLNAQELVLRPESTMRWIGPNCSVHVDGIVIFEGAENYSNRRVLVVGPTGDSTMTEAKFEPGQANPRIEISISPALAANVRSVLQTNDRQEIPRKWDPDADPGRLRDGVSVKVYSPTTMVMKAAEYEEAGVFEKAFELYAQVINADPKYSDAYLKRSFLRLRTKEMEKSIADFKEAIRLAPYKDAAAYEARAQVWLEIGDFDQAVADYSEAIRRDPYNKPVYVDRARIWTHKGDLQKALTDYSKAIQLGETAPDKYSECQTPYLQRARLLAALGEFEKAIEDYTARMRDDSSISSNIGRGKLWWKTGNLDNALLDFTEAIRKEEAMNRRVGGESADAHNALAFFLATVDDARYRNGKRALEYATRACDLSNWISGDSFDALAAVRAETGDFQLAAAWQAKAIELLQAAKDKPDAARLKQLEERLELYRSGKPCREKVEPRAPVDKSPAPNAM